MFDSVITQNDHPSCVKHVLRRIHVFFTLFAMGCGGGGGGGGGGGLGRGLHRRRAPTASVSFLHRLD